MNLIKMDYVLQSIAKKMQIAPVSENMNLFRKQYFSSPAVLINLQKLNNQTPLEFSIKKIIAVIFLKQALPPAIQSMVVGVSGDKSPYNPVLINDQIRSLFIRLIFDQSFAFELA